MIEWELTSKCNYKCNYCSLPNIKAEADHSKLNFFIKETLEPYKDQEIFCFGGEPFLHPEISFIVDMLYKYNRKFIIQTNMSKKSVDVMLKLTHDLHLQVSIHPTEVSIENVIQDLTRLQTVHEISKIDVMYTGLESFKYYQKISKIYNGELTLLPITGFYETGSCELTYEFNKYRNSPYSKFINFEPYKIGDRYRSDIWEDYCSGKLSTFGEVCKYKDDYILYDSSLNLYNCCYRENIETFCTHTKCFLM